MTEPTSLPLSVSTLLSNLDALKLELLPLSDHFAVKCDEHSRETYGALLAALLLTGGEISAEQSRLFKLLLGSLKLGDIQAKLFERAQALNLDALREFFRVARENELTTSFFMDALVLCRLSGPLVDAQHQLLSELADLLKLPEADLPVIASLAAVALGLPCEVDIPSEFDRATVSAWEEFLFRTLTADRLATGVLRGWWLVAEPIKLNAGWSIENARVRFTGEGSLTSETNERISIFRSYLERPIIKLSGNLGFRMELSSVHGVYEKHRLDAAIQLMDIYASHFEKTNFKTINTVSIWSIRATLDIVGCNFIECGNISSCGGAIRAVPSMSPLRSQGALQAVEKIHISYCSFIDCVGRVGGAIYATALNDSAITNTNFINCKSAYQPENISNDLNTYVFGGGAIFSGHSIENSINKCKFQNTTVNLGGVENAGYSAMIKSSEFIDTCISVCNVYSNFPVHSDCTFNNKIYKSAVFVTPNSAQKWWSEFK